MVQEATLVLDPEVIQQEVDVNITDMTKNTFFIVPFILLAGLLKSQTAPEAFSITRQIPLYSARSMGVMNSLEALGADYSNVATNPAGIANFRQSELMITSSVNMRSNKAQFLNNPINSGLKFGAAVDQFGLIITSRPERNNHWRQLNFSVGYQRLMDFDRETGSGGLTEGSITESFLEQAQGLTESEMNPFYEGLAYDAALLLTDQPDSFTIDLPFNALIDKFDSRKVSGSAGAFNFGFAGNYMDKWLIGVSLFFPNFNYSSQRVYSEEDISAPYPYFDGLEYLEQQEMSGRGIQAKLGLIYNFNRRLRLGYSIHTPIRYKVDIESYTTDLNYDIVDPMTGESFNFNRLSPLQVYEYNLITSWHHRLSMGSVIGKSGFISGVLTVRNNGGMELDLADNFADLSAQEFENDFISENFDTQWSAQLGAEKTLGSVFRVRGGIGYQTSAWEDYEDHLFRLSAGIGWRWRSFYLDLAYMWQQNSYTYSPYEVKDYNQSFIEEKQLRHHLALTLGLKF